MLINLIVLYYKLKKQFKYLPAIFYIIKNIKTLFLRFKHLFDYLNFEHIYNIVASNSLIF